MLARMLTLTIECSPTARIGVISISFRATIYNLPQYVLEAHQIRRSDNDWQKTILGVTVGVKRVTIREISSDQHEVTHQNKT